MESFNQSPVTSIEEQATGYAPAENGNQSLTDSQGSSIPGSNCAAQSNTTSRQEMEKEQAAGCAPVNEKEVQSSNDGKATTDSYKLSASEIEFCREAVKDIVNILEPDGLACNVFETSVINLSKAQKAKKVQVARLKMNRKPKDKAVKALKDAIIQVGQQIMLLVVPAKVAVKFGFEIESFDGKDIPEDALNNTIAIIDGQTRLEGYLKAVAESGGTEIPDLYAYFPLNWTQLNGMLQSINLKVFSWKNSDFMTGVQCNNNIDKSDKTVFSDIQELVDQGYNYTAACEWRILKKGIIVKNKLVKAINSSTLEIDISRANYGLTIFEEVKKKFSGDKRVALKTKTLSELVIDKWEKICPDLSQKEATSYMAAFISGLDEKEVNEMVKPSSYVRGAGKKKEEFVKKEFEKAFDKFSSTHPYSEFKKNDCK